MSDGTARLRLYKQPQQLIQATFELLFSLSSKVFRERIEPSMLQPQRNPNFLGLSCEAARKEQTDTSECPLNMPGEIRNCWLCFIEGKQKIVGTMTAKVHGMQEEKVIKPN